MLLDGVDDFIQLDSKLRSAPRTVSFHVRLDIVRKQMLAVSDVSAFYEYLGMEANGAMSWGDFNTPSYTVLSTAPLAWDVGQWYLVTMVRTSTSRTLLRDGVVVGVDAHGLFDAAGANNYGFGKAGTGGLATYVALAGSIDDICVWDALALPTPQVLIMSSSSEPTSRSAIDTVIPELDGPWTSMDVFELTDLTWLFVVHNQGTGSLHGFKWNPATKTAVAGPYLIATGVSTATTTITRLKDLSLGMYIVKSDGSAAEHRSLDDGVTWAELTPGSQGITQDVIRASAQHQPGINELALAEVRTVDSGNVSLNFGPQDSPVFSWRANEAPTGVPATDETVPDYGANTLPGTAENSADRLPLGAGRRDGEGARLFTGATSRLRLPYSALLDYVTPGSLVAEVWLRRGFAAQGFAESGYAALLTNDASEANTNGAFFWALMRDGRQRLTWGTASVVQSIEQVFLLDIVAHNQTKITDPQSFYHLAVHWQLGAMPKLILNGAPVLTRVVQGTGLVAPTAMPVTDWIIGDPSATGTRGLAGASCAGVRVFTSTATRTQAKISAYCRGAGL